MGFFRKRRLSVPVLTYHSLNVTENSYEENDHLAFESDLKTIDELGFRIIPLVRLVDGLHKRIAARDLHKCVAITIDDGSWLDFHDVIHPDCGKQRSFFNILRDFQTRCGGTGQDSLHISSFVIASPQARDELDQRTLLGKGWWGDDWWAEANASGLMSIECHSWDHVHEDLDEVAQVENLKGDFEEVANFGDCTAQVRQAAEYIEQAALRRPLFYAYPWGQASKYMVDEFMPRYRAEHLFRAAFSIDPRHVTSRDNIWNLPRYVCGRDWKSPEELVAILQQKT